MVAGSRCANPSPSRGKSPGAERVGEAQQRHLPAALFFIFRPYSLAERDAERRTTPRAPTVGCWVREGALSLSRDGRFIPVHQDALITTLFERRGWVVASRFSCWSKDLVPFSEPLLRKR